MARQETEKEDLLRQATALVERVELSSTSRQPVSNVFAGFRPDGAASIFFGSDPVYHFNAAGELRRAYCDGLLFKATRGRLMSLHRLRQSNEVQLLRHELTEAEQADFLLRLQGLLADLATGLNRNAYAVVGQAPSDAQVVARLKAWLAQLRSISIASVANVSPLTRRHRS